MKYYNEEKFDMLELYIHCKRKVTLAHERYVDYRLYTAFISLFDVIIQIIIIISLNILRCYKLH